MQNLNQLSASRFKVAPRQLFQNGEKGAWFDPSDFSTMYQDSAGTTPVTAAGQPVGKILDKSGNGYHATQATTTSRPTIQVDSNGLYYLSFDGVDDSLTTSAIGLTGTNKVSVFSGLRKNSDAAIGMFAETSANASSGSYQGAFYLTAPENTSGDMRAYCYTSGGAPYSTVTSGVSAPISMVYSVIFDLSVSANIVQRINGSKVGTQTLPGAITGNFGNQPLYIGRRNNASLPFNGRMYGLIVRGAVSSNDTIYRIERWMNAKMRAY